MQVSITGRVHDSAGVAENGRIEFSQAQRIDNGEFLITSSPAVAQVVGGELKTLSGDQFKLPSNPESTAVRVREVLGGKTFEWWTAVPEAESVEYRELPLMESDEVPDSVWGPPPWVTQVEQLRDETVSAIQDGAEIAEALGGLSGIQGLVEDANSAADRSSDYASASGESAQRSSEQAARAEAAANSIDMSSINQRLDGMDAGIAAKADTQYVDEAVAPLASRVYVDDAISRHYPSSDIKHVESSGYSYEVIRVRGGFGSIRKVQPKAVSASGTVPVAQLLTPKGMASESGYRTLVNADACGGGSTQRINGLHIIDGKAVQNFGVQPGPLQGSNLESLLLMKDGSFRTARASDGKTAAQYVAEGAYASFGYGPILVEGGTARKWQTDARFSGFATDLSGRTILGATADGTYVIIIVDGKSGSYGIAGDAMGVLAKSEGCHVAIVLDGGGSTQAMWNGSVVHPSTDAAGERTTMSYIAVAAPTSNEYDSGLIPIPVASGVTGVGGNAPLAVRQLGSQVSLMFAASVAIPVDSWVEVSSGGLPARYHAETPSYGRGVIYGTSGAAIGVSKSDGNDKINIRSRTPGLTGINGAEGSISYRAKNA